MARQQEFYKQSVAADAKAGSPVQYPDYLVYIRSLLGSELSPAMMDTLLSCQQLNRYDLSIPVERCRMVMDAASALEAKACGVSIMAGIDQRGLDAMMAITMRGKKLAEVKQFVAAQAAGQAGYTVKSATARLNGDLDLLISQRDRNNMETIRESMVRYGTEATERMGTPDCKRPEYSRMAVAIVNAMADSIVQEQRTMMALQQQRITGGGSFEL